MENNPEIVNYIKNVGKELAHAVKKDPNVINFLKNPITEFFNPNENRARVRSVGYSSMMYIDQNLVKVCFAYFFSLHYEENKEVYH